MVRYSEPEEHLDELATKLITLPGITQQSAICGVSFKDDTLLARLLKHGFERIVRLRGKEDLRITKPVYGTETIQQHMTVANAKRIVRRWGKQDIVIARHILEHAFDPQEFMKAVKEILSPHGYLVLEVPGMDSALRDLDYSTIWEEHTLYFTKATFRWLFSFFGFSPVHHTRISYPLEDSLIAIARVEESPGKKVSHPRVRSPRKQAETFALGFLEQKRALHTRLKGQGTIALFGAGHLGCVWINIFGLGGIAHVFVDNDGHKAGLRMPGSGIPISTTDAVNQSIDLCLLCANPRNENAILKKNASFFRLVREVASIFPSSKRAIIPLRGLRLVKKMPGGYNCALYIIIDEKGDTYIAKEYRDSEENISNRLLVEFESLSFLWKHGVRTIPEPVVMSPEDSLGVYRFVKGTRLPKGRYALRDVSLAIEFWRQLHVLKHVPEATKLPMAKDACFCIAQYYESIDERLQRFTKLPQESHSRKLHAFLHDEFVPVYKQIKDIIGASGIDVQETLPKKHRTLSPSDFGFHNALRVAGGRLVFVDFEYFGWDDPAKLVADFFLHPKMNLPYHLRTELFDRVAAVIAKDRAFPERLARVYMLQSLRWVLIMLNAFLRQEGDSPRAVMQLGKAGAFVQRTRAELNQRPFPLSLLV